MSAKEPLKIAIMWHMHQPHYRNAQTQQYELPWTYLHAIKDYIDMVAYLEAEPAARVTVNFAPVLLEQLDDYAQQIRAFLNEGRMITDPLLATLGAETISAGEPVRQELLRACLRANEDRLVKRFPAFAQLAKMAKWVQNNKEQCAYLTDQYFADLLVWYHLAWMAETVRRENKLVQALQEKAKNFSIDDRRALLSLIGELIEQVIPRYRKLAEQQQIELACSPYMHPIVPLLLDFQSTKEAMPHAELPQAEYYPGGEERARWHIHKGVEVFEKYFGFKPKGCWPSEGSLSEATVKLCGEYGFKWLASGESVMRNSLGQSPAAARKHDGECMHHLYQLNDLPVRLFFRDDGLSDEIGFTYSSWHADDAVNNFLHHLENIASVCPDRKNAVVAVILDGENAWEYYPENGYYFLSTLYKKLAKHPQLRMATFSEVVEVAATPTKLDHLIAGSWVYGTFSTWIGDKDKNRGWDLLVEAKNVFDQQVSQQKLTGIALECAMQQLAICEGSDWFWWFGDYNPAESVSDFERLFRTHLLALYECMDVQPPAHLSEVISKGGGAPSAGGVMRHGQQGKD